MNDSQIPDYLQILQSLMGVKGELMQSRRQWEQVPEIVNLSVKAVAHLFQQYSESFLEHKTLINEQSLKQTYLYGRIKELDLKVSDKVTKKKIEGYTRKEDDSMSEYEKLIKDSRFEKDKHGAFENDKYGAPTVEELKTIAQIIAQNNAEEMRNNLHSHQLKIEERITTLKEEVKNRMFEIERERREWVHECKQAHSRIESSQIKLQNDEKISHLQLSNKRMAEGLSHLVNHLQQNFLTKQEVNLLIERQKERKSPQKSKLKQQKHKQKGEQDELQKSMQLIVGKFKNEQRRQWTELKQTVMKEIGRMVNSDTMNNLIDSFQKNTHEKYQSLSAVVSKLEAKMNSWSKHNEGVSKELLSKSQKRVEKKGSPSKSIESIQQSLLRLEKAILEKQYAQIRRIELQVQQKIGSYDERIIKELDRRQKHLCEVIEETYNHHLQTKIYQQGGEFKGPIKKLFSTNLFCRYLYIGTKECKKDSCIPWQKEVLNNVVENFAWKKDSPIILVNVPGLYKVEVGLFRDVDSESIILLNGDAFAEIPRPVNNRSTGVKVRGAIFSEILLLPGKSKISVRVSQHFYGQAFFSMEQL